MYSKVKFLHRTAHRDSESIDIFRRTEGTEKVGSHPGGEGCSTFYLELAGDAVLIRKPQVAPTSALLCFENTEEYVHTLEGWRLIHFYLINA